MTNDTLIAPADDGRLAGPTASPVVSVRRLHMSYGAREAVAGIDLDVYPGEIFAFLGPNGAGKTTTVEILEGFRSRTGGQVSVLGVDPERAGRSWRARIGVVLQESQPEGELTAAECLSLYAGYYPTPRPVGDTLRLVGLEECAELRCGRLSGGQRRRLDLALALVGDPDLVFLDEPTTGFDPSARRSAWAVIASLRDLGKTVFLTTHHLDEAEHLADRIAVMVHGRIVAAGTAETLGGRDRRPSVIRFAVPAGMGVGDLPPEVASALTKTSGSRIEARSHRPLGLLGVLAMWAAGSGTEIRDLEVSRPTLEEVYLQLTGAER
jgi:ABC-2 type transport system ATP-binding protein